MAEYIEREAAINAVYEAYADGESAYDALIALPAADVREVVLCKDCKHSAHDWKGNRYCGLVKTYNTVDDDWFCADGERLTNCGADMREEN